MADAAAVAGAIAAAAPPAPAVSDAVARAMVPPAADTQFPYGIEYPRTKNSLVSSMRRIYCTPQGQSSWTISANGNNASELTFQLPSTNMVVADSFQLQFDVTMTGGTNQQYCVWGSGFDFFSKFRIVQAGTSLYETTNYNHAAAWSDMHYETQSQSWRSGVVLENKGMGRQIQSTTGLYTDIFHAGQTVGSSTVLGTNGNDFRLNLKDGPFASHKYLPLPYMSQVQFIWTFETLGAALVCPNGFQGTETLTFSNIRLYYKAVTLPANIMDGIAKIVSAGELRLNLIATESQSIAMGTQTSDTKQISWRVTSLNELVILGVDNTKRNDPQYPTIGNYSGMNLTSAWFQLGTEYFPPAKLQTYADFFTQLEDVTGNSSLNWDTGRYMGRLRNFPVLPGAVDSSAFSPYSVLKVADGFTTSDIAIYPNLWQLWHDRTHIDFATFQLANTQWNTANFMTWQRNGFGICMSFVREVAPDVTAGINTAQQSVITNLILERSSGAQDLQLVAFAYFQKTWFLTSSGSVVVSF